MSTIISASQHSTSGPQVRGAVAIIGMGGCFPDAPNVEAFWDNICRGHVAIGEVPAERWDASIYFDPDRRAPDRTYSRIGGYIRHFNFDSRRFRIPPRSLACIDDLQKMALSAVAEALESADLKVFEADLTGRAFARDRTAVIMGNSMGGEAEDLTSLRVWLTGVIDAIRQHAATHHLSEAQRDGLIDSVRAQYEASLPPVTEDSMPGELSNCITGRVTNAFDLQGPNFTTDAACAASIAAIQTAIYGLLAGDFDMAVAGGADRSMDPPTYVKFSKIGALSSDGSAPFDARANGFVMGEGVGVLLLKRLEHAERDGDRILAVIRGIGAASDGRGKGITAPNPRGQRTALDRAYAQAGVPITSVGLFEAHGTSTPTGDTVELQVLSGLLAESGAPRQVPIGSVKSMIGHLKSASGAASFIKVALALHHKVLPPSANFQHPVAASPLEKGYLMVNTTTRPWPHDIARAGAPRRAGVSSFGFGGTNFHAVLEEYVPSAAAAAEVTAQHVPAMKGCAAARFEVAVGPSSAIASAPMATQSEPAAAAARRHDPDEIGRHIARLFAEATGYQPQDMVPGHELEADLGIDTVKQAEVIGQIRSHYGLPSTQGPRLSAMPTLQSIIDYVLEHAALPKPPPPAAQHGDAAATAAAGQKALASHDHANAHGRYNITAAAAGAAVAEAPGVGLQVFVFGASHKDELLAEAQSQLRAAPTWGNDGVQGRHTACHMAARLAFVAHDATTALAKVASAALKAPRMLAAQGIFLAEGAPMATQGKVAFIFPGQGSQYLGMLRDLAAAYPIVAATFAEADRVLAPLVGHTLTSIVWAEESEVNAARLRETQNCQPAMLTADVAMWRLLLAHGVAPAMVAGHSLGEYAAAVAAGVLSFADALYAVSARGREMASVRVNDVGKMAMVATHAGRVEGMLAEISGYVIAANKNCHTQTVIAGNSAAVDQAVAHFARAGIEAQPIAVSHAFHSRIVAPAAEPLRRVLGKLDVRAPRVPLSSNVTGGYYPNGREDIVELMACQLASPVQFIDQVERLYQDGARIFVEVGPRRAITGFVRNILGDRSYAALAANHPKKPGVDGFLELLAALAAMGVEVQFDGQAHLQAQAQPAMPPVSEEQPGATDPASIPASGSMGGRDDAVVISGMAVALPQPRPTGTLDDDLFASLLAGDNYIQPLHEEERQAILDKNVVRLNKAKGAFATLQNTAEVIQLVARLGDVDLAAYNVDAALAEALDDTGRLAIATGLDALRDAGLPLMQRWRATSTGAQLHDRWALPPKLAERTGVILASAFVGLSSIIEEVSREAADRGRRKGAAAMQAFIDGWANSLRDDAEAARLRADFAAQTQAQNDAEGAYKFNRKWLFRALSLGHAQLAQAICAQGPNTQINAACASGPQAMGIAQDWLLAGRCDRVVVVTADNATHAAALPWLGAAFLAAGAASVEPRVEHAAVPFGAQRNGMILGAGAAAFVVERRSEVVARGMQPIAQLVCAEFGNSAYHGTRMDVGHIEAMVERAVASACGRLGISRPDFARACFFMSHETYTPARGGSAAAEVSALRHAFGQHAKDVLVANTKGRTGHPMGASLEDAVAIKGLQRQTLPGVANLNEVDPAFADIQFAPGGRIERELAVRFGAGFGSQVAVAIYRRMATQEARMLAPETYAGWLVASGAPEGAGLEVVGRTLRVSPHGRPVTEVGIASLRLAMPHQTAEPATAAAERASAGGRDAAPSEVADAAAAPGEPLPTPVAPDCSDGAPTKQMVLAELVSMFAAQTGYDPADLHPSHALEADLGIDTVKQAEIFGLIRTHYGLATDLSFRLSEVQTLASMAEFVARHVRQAAPVDGQAPQPEDHDIPPSSGMHDETASQAPRMPIAVASAPVAGGEAEILATVTKLFAEHTGYALADLAANHQLEADLGVDTVKQAEILAVIRQQYALPADTSFKLSHMQTLASIAAEIAAQLRGGVPPPPQDRGDGALRHTPTQGDPAAPAPEAARAPDASAPFAARRVHLQPVALGQQAADLECLRARHVVVAGGEPAARQAMRAALEECGAHIHLIEAPSHAPGAARAQAFEARLRQLGPKPWDMLVYLVAGTAKLATVHAPAAELFMLARFWAQAAKVAPTGGLLVVGEGGGGFGFHVAGPGELQGAALAAVAGAVKSLAKEWPQVRCLAVDMAVPEPWQQAARRALQAWGSWTIQPDAAAELVWLDGQWWVPRRQSASIVPQSRALGDGSLVLATGGGRGVTFGLLQALAACRAFELIILGRTAGIEPRKSAVFGLDEVAQKEVARRHLIAANKRATPVAIRAWIERELGRIEIYRNIEALRRAGCRVELITCDVADPVALEQTLRIIRAQRGKVDLLLHGAGVEESRFIVDKEPQAFFRVFNPKAEALLQLWDALAPRRTVTMGSVSGRFGNAGQVDYAAANEMMAGLARAPSRHMLNLGWTAWDDIGMAQRGSVRQVLGAHGVQLLPAATGLALGASLIDSDVVGDVVVAGRLGAFERGEAHSEAVVLPAQPPAHVVPPVFERAFVREDGVRAFMVTLDPKHEVGLDHHRIEGVPYLAGVLGIELMAQAAGAALGAPATQLHDVRFAVPVKFFRDAPLTLAVEVRVQGEQAQVVLASDFVGPQGARLRREHFFARVTTAPVPPPPRAPTDAADLELARAPNCTPVDVYRRYFHGPAFQVLGAVDVLAENGSDATVRRTQAPWLTRLPHAQMLTMAHAREAGLQVAGLWEMVELGRMALPAGITRVQLGHAAGFDHSPPPQPSPLRVMARRRPSGSDAVTFDVWTCDASGHVVDFMEGYRTHVLRELMQAERFEPSTQALWPRQARPTSLLLPLAQAESLLEAAAATDLAHYLTPTELARLEQFTSPKRRVEFVGARLAGKRLIRETLFGRAGATVPYHAITIDNDALGAPVVHIVGDPAPPRLSLSHSSGVAAAFMSPHPEVRCGIDVERVVARDASFAATYFTAREQQQARRTDAEEHPLAFTQMWAVKEAVLKALGVGARVDFRDVEALSGTRGWHVVLHAEAEARAHALGVGAAQVEVDRQGDIVVARVLLPRSGTALPAKVFSSSMQMRP